MSGRVDGPFVGRSKGLGMKGLEDVGSKGVVVAVGRYVHCDCCCCCCGIMLGKG